MIRDMQDDTQRNCTFKKNMSHVGHQRTSDTYSAIVLQIGCLGHFSKLDPLRK